MNQGFFVLVFATSAMHPKKVRRTFLLEVLNLADEWEVAVVALVIQAITNDELVRYLEAHVVQFAWHLQRFWFFKQRHRCE